jgi:hypothetical protein
LLLPFHRCSPATVALTFHCRFTAAVAFNYFVLRNHPLGGVALTFHRRSPATVAFDYFVFRNHPLGDGCSYLFIPHSTRLVRGNNQFRNRPLGGVALTFSSLLPGDSFIKTTSQTCAQGSDSNSFSPVLWAGLLLIILYFETVLWAGLLLPFIAALRRRLLLPFHRRFAATVS